MDLYSHFYVSLQCLRWCVVWLCWLGILYLSDGLAALFNFGGAIYMGWPTDAALMTGDFRMAGQFKKFFGVLYRPVSLFLGLSDWFQLSLFLMDHLAYWIFQLASLLYGYICISYFFILQLFCCNCWTLHIFSIIQTNVSLHSLVGFCLFDLCSSLADVVYCLLTPPILYNNHRIYTDPFFSLVFLSA